MQTRSTECQFTPDHIKIPLRHPCADYSTLVTIHTKELIAAYNKKFHTHKKSIEEILSIAEAERENHDLFLEEYCLAQAIKQKILLTSRDINYFIRHASHKMKLHKATTNELFVLHENAAAFSATLKDRISDLMQCNLNGITFNNGIEPPDVVLNLVSNKKTEQIKLVNNKTHRTLQRILKEAKRSAEKLAEAGIEKISFPGRPTLTAEELMNKINAGHLFFRGVFIQGDLDLSQLKNKDLSKIDFRNAVFSGKADFSRCQFRCDNFQGAEFTQAVTYELHNKKIVVNEDNAKILYDLFVIEYSNIRDKERYLKLFRGNILDRLKKLNLNDVEKMNYLLQHAQNEPNKRTSAALRKIAPLVEQIQKKSADSATTDDQAGNDHGIFPEESRFPSRASSHSHIELNVLLDVPATNQILLCDFFEDTGELKHSGLIEFQDDFELLFSHNQTEELKSKIDAAIVSAKKALDEALQQFNSPDLLGCDSDSKEARTQRKSREDKIVASYIFLKKANNDAIKKYDIALRKIIYPHYLRYVVYCIGDCKDEEQKRYLRYNLIESLFKVSQAIPNCASLKMLSDHRHDTVSGSQFFITEPLGKQFSTYCQAEWGKMSLTELADAKCVDNNSVANVCEHMKKHVAITNPDKRVLLEKQYYLSELIKKEKFLEAKYEAQAMKVAFGNDLFSRESILHHVISVAVDALKQKMIDEVMQYFAANSNTESVHDLKYTYRKNKLEEIFNSISIMDNGVVKNSYNDIYSSFVHFSNPIWQGIINTRVLKAIAESALENRPFDADLFHKISPEKNYYAFVWVGDEKEHSALIKCLQNAFLSEENISRKQLLSDLKTVIENAALISAMLRPGEKKPERMQPDCISRIMRSAYGLDEVKIMLHNALSDIWNYGNFSKVIQKNPLQFADPKNPATRESIGRHYLESPDNNFAKYKFAFHLYHKLNTEIEALEKCVDYDWYRKKCNDCFAEIESGLSQILRGLGVEGKKTFGLLISDALIKVGDARQSWMDYLEKTVSLPQSTVMENRRYTLTH